MERSSAYIRDEYWNKFYCQVRAFVVGIIVGTVNILAMKYDISSVVLNLKFTDNYVLNALGYGVMFLIMYTGAVFVIPWFHRRSENVKILVAILSPVTVVVAGVIGAVMFIPYTIRCLVKAYV